MARRGSRDRCPYDHKTTFKNWRKGERTARRLIEESRLYWCAYAGGWHLTRLQVGEYDKRRSKGLRGELENDIDFRKEPEIDLATSIDVSDGKVSPQKFEKTPQKRSVTSMNSSIRHWSVLHCEGGGIVPVQYWGEFINNWKFYFRMRSAWCSLRVGPPNVEIRDLPLINPLFDREQFDAAFNAGQPYPHAFFWGPVGEHHLYPDDPLVGWFKEEDDLQESFRMCFEQIKEEIGLGDMVCPKCKQGQHGNCPEGTWCDCQHRSSYPEVEAAAEAARSKRDQES